MDLSEGYMSHGHQEQFQPASESADPSSVSSLQVSTSPKLPKSPQSLRPQQGQHGSSPGSPLKNQRHSHSKRDDHPKKDGCGGKGAWGGLLDTDDDCVLDLNDPNYSSNEVYKGFQKLLESTDDLIVDIPNAVDILALFIA